MTRWTITSTSAFSTAFEQERFHCAEDNAHVRNRVFELISGRLAGVDIDGLVVEKRKTGPALTAESRFYPKMLGYLLKYVLARPSHVKAQEIIIITDTIPVRRRRHAVEKAIKLTLGQMLPKGSRYRILHHNSRSHYGLQVADYCCWAVFRKHERGDSSYFDRIRPAVRSEFDIFQTGTRQLLLMRAGKQKRPPRLLRRRREPLGLLSSGGNLCPHASRPSTVCQRFNRNYGPPLHMANSSSGSGSKKLSGTVKTPAMEPGCRLPRLVMGASRATGLPFRAMVTSSPASTCASRRERWGLASCTFTVTMAGSPAGVLANDVTGTPACQSGVQPMTDLDFTEAGAAQFPMVRHAAEMGWTPLPPSDAIAMRGGEAGLLFRGVLEAALRRFNPWMSEDDARSVVGEASRRCCRRSRATGGRWPGCAASGSGTTMRSSATGRSGSSTSTTRAPTSCT